MPKRSTILRSLPTLTALLVATLARPADADVVVQVPVDALLNGRPVTTLTGGSVVPWTVGLDQTDGFITTAANAFLKQKDPALPDDGLFAASANRPEITLHFSNVADAKSPQARIVTGVANFEVPVPTAKYSKLYLIIASSYGDCPLTLTLGYADASSTAQNVTLPDWGTGKPLPTTPAIFFNLISGLHKWNQQGMSVDTPTHSITGIELSPDSSKPLSSVRIEKTGAPQTLAFWGATGVATSAPAGSGGASGSGGNGGNGGSSAGSAGTGGSSAGTGGSAAGASGSAGAPGSNGGDAPGGTSAIPAAAGAPSFGGFAGTSTASAGASPTGSPTSNANGSCAVRAVGTPSAAARLTCLGLLLLPLCRARRRRRKAN
jgi:hypothetical protein